MQCIYRYISVYISEYITARGRRLVCSVHSCKPPLMVAGTYRYILIYRYIGGRRPVCSLYIGIHRYNRLAATTTHPPTHTHTANDRVASINVLTRNNARCYLVRHALWRCEVERVQRAVSSQHCCRFLLLVFNR